MLSNNDFEIMQLCVAVLTCYVFTVGYCDVVVTRMQSSEWLWLIITITSLSKVRVEASGLYKPTDNVTIFDAGSIESALNHRYRASFVKI